MTVVEVRSPRGPNRVYPGYVFDLDGTVYLGDCLLPYAAETIGELRRRGSRVVYVTNKPLETASEYAAKLSRLGVPTARSDVVTSVDALVDYLRREHPDATLLAVAEASAIDELEDAGFCLTKVPSQAEVVVVSFDRTFDYEKLNAAFQAVRYGGATIVATNPDPYCPTPEGGIPDCAAMLAAIEACTGASAEAVVGKPSVHMARALLGRLGMRAEDVAVVGDRLLTDMAMARALNMTGILVLTGATRAENLLGAPVQPQYLIDSLSELVPEGLSPDELAGSSLHEEESE
ncbi:MAG: HAD-IIA family hydrolase [Acidimicrobiales bacterium]|jgi:NagD protein